MRADCGKGATGGTVTPCSRVECSRIRQRRLLPICQQRQLDAIVIGDPQHVYYVSAYRPFWLQQAAFIEFADGRSWLATANQPARNVAADDVVAFEASRLGTQSQDQPLAVAQKIIESLKARHAKRIGLDASAVSSQVALGFDGQSIAIDPDLWQMRRRKDPDELELMKVAIRCTEAMYARARQIIAPGMPELQVFAELHATGHPNRRRTADRAAGQ